MHSIKNQIFILKKGTKKGAAGYIRNEKYALKTGSFEDTEL